MFEVRYRIVVLVEERSDWRVYYHESVWISLLIIHIEERNVDTIAAETRYH